MTEKRSAAAFIPYLKKGGSFSFFLQKRDCGAPTNPGRIGFFGGGIEEGERAEEAVVREAKEELNFEFKDPALFSRYETAKGILYAFLLEVDASFQSSVTVFEGESGTFFSEEAIRENVLVTDKTRFVLSEVAAHLRALK